VTILACRPQIISSAPFHVVDNDFIVLQTIETLEMRSRPLPSSSESSHFEDSYKYVHG